jgi:hypothetical protein
LEFNQTYGSLVNGQLSLLYELKCNKIPSK